METKPNTLQETVIALAALGLLGLGVLVNRRPLVDIIFMVLMGLVVVAVVVRMLTQGRRRRQAEVKERAWARARRDAVWEPVWRTLGDTEWIVFVRYAEVGGETEEVEPPRRFEKLPTQQPGDEGAWDAAFAEAMGRAANRAVTLNARHRS